MSAGRPYRIEVEQRGPNRRDADIWSDAGSHVGALSWHADEPGRLEGWCAGDKARETWLRRALREAAAALLAVAPAQVRLTIRLHGIPYHANVTAEVKR